MTWRQLTLAGYFLTALGGMALGAGITIKALDKEYEQNLAKELLEQKKAYDRLHKRGEFSDPIALVGEKAEELVEQIVEHLGYSAELDETVVVQTENVFLKEPVWDHGAELQKRTSIRPYVITEDEFFKNDSEYPQIHLQFYTKEGVLTDQADVEIVDGDDQVGDDNLLRFGHGSNDKNIVYIRNDRLEREYEVVRIRGSYGEIVHGFIEHSDRKRKVPKKRRDDG